MATKGSAAKRLELVPSNRRGRRARPTTFDVISQNRKRRTAMSAKTLKTENEYLCAIERNQNGKYTVRVRAVFSEREDNQLEQQSRHNAWTLPVYFLASSFNGAMKKLEESLQLLQKHEDRLRFWGVEHSDDPNMAGELLHDSGLRIDRRREFPRKVAELAISRERVVPASSLAPVRRILADCIGQERPSAALASD
jgi:hypothetical protein